MTVDNTRRFGRSFLFLGAVLLGASAPLSQGCQPPCEEYETHDNYKVLTDRPDWVPDSGRGRIDDGRLVISYTTTDGSKWEVEYVF